MRINPSTGYGRGGEGGEVLGLPLDLLDCDGRASGAWGPGGGGGGESPPSGIKTFDTSLPTGGEGRGLPSLHMFRGLGGGLPGLREARRRRR